MSLRNIDLEPENGKQLQVTIIKITESKEINSFNGLDVSGSTGPGGAAAPLAPHPPASYGSGCGFDCRDRTNIPGGRQITEEEGTVFALQTARLSCLKTVKSKFVEGDVNFLK